MEISKNGYTFFIGKMDTETDKELIQRSWFIVNQLDELDSENFKTKFEKTVKMSRIWHNIKYLHCKYIEPVMSNISEKEADNYC